MCSGRVDPVLLESTGIGGGWRLVRRLPSRDCHYTSGNYKTIRHGDVEKLTEQMGIEDDRIRLDWVAASRRPVAEIIRI